MEKKNLMLRIDKDVIDKAKALGINISALTENVLKTEIVIDENRIVPTDELRNEYREVFKHIIVLINKWNVPYHLKIGEEIVWDELVESTGKVGVQELTHSYYLTAAGTIEHYVEEFDHLVSRWKLEADWPITTIFKAEQIIAALVNTIYEEAKRNQERLQELQILRNFLEKLSNRKNDEGK
ncbi:type II toxin-antitoxin system CcdA family antitoxin [Candidatus Pacearchaeota archaeon]|nr:type II toxin-antitoxin system CcdA family antitoxin [Candidatus Pacearchaeota archaeon]